MVELSRTPARPRAGRAARPATPIAVLSLGGLFALALLAPLPTAAKVARAEVVDRIAERLPGWAIARADASWEGAWTVVARCGSRQVGFQLIPGHGLRPQDAWLQPENAYTRSRLRTVSDHSRYLIWFAGDEGRTLSCQNEIARQGDAPTRGGATLD